MRVRAKAVCFSGGGRRRQGAVFEYELKEGESLPKWLEPAPGAALQSEDPRVAEVPEPVALSEITKATASVPQDPQTLGQAGAGQEPEVTDPAELSFLQ